MLPQELSDMIATSISSFFKVKSTFEMLTVHRQQHSFSTHERVLLWQCQNFWDRNCLDLKGTRTPNLRIYAKCSNLLIYIRARHLLSLVFEYWLWWCRYFRSNVYIWNVNSARATAFIIFPRMDILWKVHNFLDRKCIDIRETRTPNLRIHAECSNPLS